ncbi:hypothetical protein BJV78DRAFT_1255181, partial [Lactifluus subvellereus]
MPGCLAGDIIGWQLACQTGSMLRFAAPLTPGPPANLPVSTKLVRMHCICLTKEIDRMLVRDEVSSLSLAVERRGAVWKPSAILAPCRRKSKSCSKTFMERLHPPADAVELWNTVEQRPVSVLEGDRHGSPTFHSSRHVLPLRRRTVASGPWTRIPLEDHLPLSQLAHDKFWNYSVEDEWRITLNLKAKWRRQMEMTRILRVKLVRVATPL